MVYLEMSDLTNGYQPSMGEIDAYIPKEKENDQNDNEINYDDLKLTSSTTSKDLLNEVNEDIEASLKYYDIIDLNNEIKSFEQNSYSSSYNGDNEIEVSVNDVEDFAVIDIDYDNGVENEEVEKEDRDSDKAIKSTSIEKSVALLEVKPAIDIIIKAPEYTDFELKDKINVRPSYIQATLDPLNASAINSDSDDSFAEDNEENEDICMSLHAYNSSFEEISVDDFVEETIQIKEVLDSRLELTDENVINSKTVSRNNSYNNEKPMICLTKYYEPLLKEDINITDEEDHSELTMDQIIETVDDLSYHSLDDSIASDDVDHLSVDEDSEEESSSTEDDEEGSSNYMEKSTSSSGEGSGELNDLQCDEEIISEEFVIDYTCNETPTRRPNNLDEELLTPSSDSNETEYKRENEGEKNDICLVYGNLDTENLSLPSSEDDTITTNYDDDYQYKSQNEAKSADNIGSSLAEAIPVDENMNSKEDKVVGSPTNSTTDSLEESPSLIEEVDIGSPVASMKTLVEEYRQENGVEEEIVDTRQQTMIIPSICNPPSPVNGENVALGSKNRFIPNMENLMKRLRRIYSKDSLKTNETSEQTKNSLKPPAFRLPVFFRSNDTKREKKCEDTNPEPVRKIKLINLDKKGPSMMQSILSVLPGQSPSATDTSNDEKLIPVEDGEDYISSDVPRSLNIYTVLCIIFVSLLSCAIP